MQCPTPSTAATAMMRRKVFSDEEKTETKLKRTLGLLDLTGIGVGSTLGAGVYVLSGEVGRENSGPAVILAFAIAAFSSILSGMCYAEFGARVPKAGSGYIYSYVTMGEFCALTIGWNLVLSYVVGTSSVAKAWSSNLDAMIGCKIRAWTVSNLPYMESDFLEDYPDAFAALIIVILAILMCYGVEEVALVNKVFTAVNIGVIIFVAISGFVKADIQNWKQTEQDVRDKLLFESTNGTAKVQCRGDAYALFSSLLTIDSDINQYNVDNYLAYGTLIGNLTEYPKTLDTRDSDGNVTAVVTPNVSDVDDSPDFCDNECWKEKQETGGYPGKGGFLPYGFSGVIAGTATCFYAFVGFDAIATTGEEAINPQRNIPISIVLSLIVCCVAYLGISASLTLMVPYYLLDKQAPLPAAFSYVGIEWASYVVGIGATCALTTR